MAKNTFLGVLTRTSPTKSIFSLRKSFGALDTHVKKNKQTLDCFLLEGGGARQGLLAHGIGWNMMLY